MKKKNDVIVVDDDIDDITKCEYDYDEKRCYYEVSPGKHVPLEKGTLYNFKTASDDYYMYVLDVEKDNHEYHGWRNCNGLLSLSQKWNY